MKKFYLMFVVLTFSLSMIACGGKTSDKASSDDAAAAPETEVETVAPAEDSGVLVKYEALVNKMIKLYEEGKFQSGDADAIAEYTKISQELADISGELQTEVQQLTPEQVQKFTELGQRLTDAATKAMSGN
ncbi:MAG: hypothetical protein LBJ60_08035 [Tannerellaceae bacterium]|jgi:hypothetical protein|nr:hypothetical protein [Tannerellaceae bacterium]